jgi:5-methyltetrahydropteroyltriglutamate--homocysteine methyltransferase
VGITVLNDGEQSKIQYSSYVKDRLTGFEGEETVRPGGVEARDFPEYAARRPATAIRRPTCNGPIQWKDFSKVQKDIDNLKAATRGVRAEEVFMTAASPGVINFFLNNRYYPSEEEYLYALAEVMKREYKAVVDAGFVLQVDCPDLAMGWNTQYADLSQEEFRKVAAMHIEVLNYALADLPPERLRMHLCWGNNEGPHHRDVALKDIIDLVLQARPTAISFVGANPRHEHEWKVWKEVKLPEDKVIIPGVIDSTTNFIEHPELVAQRIVRYAQLVGRENVIAGSDCGFATFARSNAVVEPEIVWPKLQAMAEGARLASKELWR